MIVSQRISIVGAGFSGTMTAVQLIRHAKHPVEIHLFDESDRMNKGVAYLPSSNHFILNVPAAKMSAFPDSPDDFLDWLLLHSDYCHIKKSSLAALFVSRAIYGEYLQQKMQDALELAVPKKITVKFHHEIVESVVCLGDKIQLFTREGEKLESDQLVLATGNQLPGNLSIHNMDFYNSPRYFQNPWKIESVLGTDSTLPVFILGNGLTMAETVVGLRENGFSGLIYSLSPNGFNMLPHRFEEKLLPDMEEEIKKAHDLRSVVLITLHYIRKLKKEGISPEPVVSTLRPLLQNLWRNFSLQEKQLFLSRFRHLWGVIRHRIAPELYNELNRLKTEKKLMVMAGRVMNLTDEGSYVTVSFREKKSQEVQSLKVGRVINCTGPETNVLKLKNNFLTRCFQADLIAQDDLKLGICANTETFQVINSKGEINSRIFTLGPNLRGELWESTAVNEIRSQAERIALSILSRI